MSVQRSAVDVLHALADGVGGPLEPVAAAPRSARPPAPRRTPTRTCRTCRCSPDVAVQALGLVLRQHEDPADVGVQAVADRHVDQSVVAPDRHRRLGSMLGQRKQPGPPAASENQRDDVLHGVPPSTSCRSTCSTSAVSATAQVCHLRQHESGRPRGKTLVAALAGFRDALGGGLQDPDHALLVVEVAARRCLQGSQIQGFDELALL